MMYLSFYFLIVFFESSESLADLPPGLSQSSGFSKRVIGGQIAKPNSWPWMVELRTSNRHLCGGSLINKEWVLTAAHCLVFGKMDQLVVRLGEHDQTKTSGTETDHRIVGYHAHDRYFAEQQYAYDIALVKISPPANLNIHVQTIGLPFLYEQVSVGTKCVLTGWGRINSSSNAKSLVLKQVELPIASYKDCAAVNDELWYSNVNLFSNLCAGDDSINSGCRGDSGGPLVCKDPDGKWILQGIVSWGSQNCTRHFYSVFTRVSSFIEWINWKKKEPFRSKFPDCKDHHYYCNEWKAKGYCSFSFISQKYCGKTCGGCDY